MKISNLLQWFRERRFEIISDKDHITTLLRSEDQIRVTISKKVISIIGESGGPELRNCKHPDTANDLKNLFKAMNIKL